MSDDEEKKKRLNAQLTNVDVDKSGVAAAGRVNYTLPVGKDSSIEAYADIEARKRKGEKLGLSAPMFGINYTRRFKSGGKVKTASARADGIARRGKTKGSIV